MTENELPQEFSEEMNQDTSPVLPEPQQAQEKMLPQSEVNRIVGRIKGEAERSAYERAKREIVSQPREESGPQLSEEQFNRLAERRANMLEAARVAQDFNSKMEVARERHPDIKRAMEDLDLGSNPHIVLWANKYPNTADIIMDLHKNPHKLANLTVLAQTNERMAQKAIAELSESIERNKDISEERPREPLSQIKPSTIGKDSGGSMTVDELRKHPRFRR